MEEDLIPDSEFLRYFFDKNNKLKNKNKIDNENLKKQEVYNKDILGDLKFSILKNNLIDINKEEKKKSLEKSISKEILFLQMADLYKNDEKMTRSLFIKKINEIIMKDDLEENLLLLSYLKKFKEEKKTLQQNSNQVKLIKDLFSKADFSGFDLNKSK